MAFTSILNEQDKVITQYLQEIIFTSNPHWKSGNGFTLYKKNHLI